MIPAEKIVNVVIPELPLLDFRHQYAVLCDRPVDQVEAFAAEHPKCFVFPFYTGAVDAVPDCSSLAACDHVMKPWYVGNLKPVVGHAIRQIVANAFDGHDTECILDEAEALP